LPVQYADYALWQHESLTGELLDKQLAYWRQQLASAPQNLALPVDRKRSAAQQHRAGNYSVAFTHELSEQLKSLSRRESATLFMTLLTGFKILLHYYAKQNDIVVGANVSNRNRAETEGLIGFFVNTVVLRSDLSGDPGFVELLKHVREVCLGAYAHQDVPFEKVVALLQPERNLDRQPLFQVKLDVDDELKHALELRGLTLSPLELPNDVGRYDLHLMMTQTKQGLVGNIVYDQNLFDEATVSMMSSQLERLLHQIVEQPELPVSALEEVLAQADKQYQAGRETDYRNSVRERFKQARQKQVMNAS
jgi:non-ribosomal peptide synthetase component F